MADTPVTPAAPEAPAAPAAPSHGAIESKAEAFDRGSIGRMVVESANEHDLNKALEAVAAKGDGIALADLRTLPGMEKYTDAELTAAWAEVRGTAKPAPAAPAAGTPAAKPRAYKVYVDGKEVTDVEKLSAAELLRATFGYTANKQEQRRNLDEVFRNAQLGHYHAERMNTLQQDLNTALGRGREATGRVQQLESLQATWTRALDAAARGDVKPLEAMIEAYVQELNAPPAERPAAPAGNAEVERQQTGLQVYQEYVWPESDKLAREFGLETKKVADAIMYLVQLEHPETATPQRLQQIVEIEIRQYLERFASDRDTAAAPDPRDAKIAELEAALGARAPAAAAHNARLAQVHHTRKAAPPSHGSVPGPAGAVESPDFKSAEDARQWVRSIK